MKKSSQLQPESWLFPQSSLRLHHHSIGRKVCRRTFEHSDWFYSRSQRFSRLHTDAAACTVHDPHGISLCVEYIDCHFRRDGSSIPAVFAFEVEVEFARASSFRPSCGRTSVSQHIGFKVVVGILAVFAWLRRHSSSFRRQRGRSSSVQRSCVLNSQS